MRRSPANSTHRSLAAFGKLQHIPRSDLFERRRCLMDEWAAYLE